MNSKKAIFVYVALACLIGVLAVHFVITRHSSMTLNQAMAMFDKVGGISNVNTEVKIVFNRFGTRESMELYGTNLNDFPILSGLGKPLFFNTGSVGYSARISIPIGGHYNRRFIFLFDPDYPVEFPYSSSCIQVASNIYVGP